MHLSRGIGTCLMKRAPGWMDQCGAEKKRVFVADGTRKYQGFPGDSVFSTDDDARREIRIEEVMEFCDSISWGGKKVTHDNKKRKITRKGSASTSDIADTSCVPVQSSSDQAPAPCLFP